MSDEGTVTMDEDEEIGQVRFVDYIRVLCFSLPFDRRDRRRGDDHHIVSSSFVIVIAGGFYRALSCELPNHSKLFFCPRMREERERDVFARRIDRRPLFRRERAREDVSLSLSLSSRIHGQKKSFE